MKSRFDEYISWIEKHYDKEVEKYKKPRSQIFKNGRVLKKEELTHEELKEYSIGIWWRDMPEERKIVEKYIENNIEEIPEEYRDIVIRCRKLGIGIKEISKFEQYIEWVKKHEDKETKKYRKPRIFIYRNGKALKINEMTEEEIEETRNGDWWKRYPKERKIIEKYENITEEEFMQLPEEEQNIILTCSKYGIKPECKIVEQMKSYIRYNVKNNSNVREELLQKVMEFNQEKGDLDETNQKKIEDLIKEGYDVNLIALEFDLPIEYVKECERYIKEQESKLLDK